MSTKIESLFGLATEVNVLMIAEELLAKLFVEIGPAMKSRDKPSIETWNKVREFYGLNALDGSKEKV